MNTLGRFPKIVGLSMGLDVPALLSAIRPAFGLLSGIPSEANLRSAYWGRKIDIPSVDLDPKRDGCGLIWYAPLLPMTSKAVQEFQEIAKPIFHQYGFDVCITLTTVTDRSFDCTLPILFDGTIEEERARAKQCYEDLFELSTKHGYFPYRVHTKSMAALQKRSNSFWDFCQTLKNSIDPNGTISPGRYQPNSCT